MARVTVIDWNGSLSADVWAPNITGEYQGGDSLEGFSSGAFYFMTPTSSAIGGGSYRLDKGGFDASRVSSLFGSSQTVQPLSVRLLPCIKA